jgi:hypothetical protein
MVVYKCHFSYTKMATLKDVWCSMGVTSVDRDGFKDFLTKLSIQINDEESNDIFTMLDINKTGTLAYEDIRVFVNLTKVYDQTKYPKKDKKPLVKRRGSYKIHPENV